VPISASVFSWAAEEVHNLAARLPFCHRARVCQCSLCACVLALWACRTASCHNLVVCLLTALPVCLSAFNLPVYLPTCAWAHVEDRLRAGALTKICTHGGSGFSFAAFDGRGCLIVLRPLCRWRHSTTTLTTSCQPRPPARSDHALPSSLVLRALPHLLGADALRCVSTVCCMDECGSVGSLRRCPYVRCSTGLVIFPCAFHKITQAWRRLGLGRRGADFEMLRSHPRTACTTSAHTTGTRGSAKSDGTLLLLGHWGAPCM
jgi:hypothetical protein